MAGLADLFALGDGGDGGTDMESSFLRFVWRYSWRSQLFILAVTVVSFPIVYMSLELPKIIINDAIKGGDEARIVLGFSLGRIEYLLALCLALLVLIGVLNALKWNLNVAMGRTGERMLRRLRYMLFEHVMRFSMARFRGTKQGELVQSMLAELEPIGGFVGEVIATPAFQGGMLGVYAGFIFVQDWRLGLAAVALFPLQGWLIPRMQARVIRLNRQRARGARALADFIGESVAQIADIHIDDGARWRLAQLSSRLHSQGSIRLELFQRKYAIKAVNNLLNQLPPFFFYSIGGWLVIAGRLDFGALVAVLAAQKEMAAPWRTILTFVQNWTDYNARYGFVVESFVGEGVLPPARVYGDPATGAPAGTLRIEIAEGGPGAGGLAVPPVPIPEGARVAVLGGQGGAREALLRMAAGLQVPALGDVTLGALRLREATLPQLGAAFGYVSLDPGIPDRPVCENLRAGLMRAGPALGNAQMIAEARITGNSEADPEGDWIDYQAAGVGDRAGLIARERALAAAAGLAPALRSLALDSRLDDDAIRNWSPVVRDARATLAQSEDAALVADLVEVWSPGALNENATLLENVFFGAPADGGGEPDALIARPEVAEVLRAIGAEAVLAAIGEDLALEFADLVKAAGRDSAVFENIAGYPAATIMAAANMVATSPSRWRAGGRRKFMIGLAARFTPARDRFDILDNGRRARLLSLRDKARAHLAAMPGFTFFDDDAVNPALTLVENVLRGARRYDRRGAARRLTEVVEAALDRAGAHDALLDLGLSARAGRDGARLSLSDRRRVGFVREVLKRPQILVLEAGTDPALLALARRELPSATLIFAAEDENGIADADIVLRINERGVVSSTPPARGGSAP